MKAWAARLGRGWLFWPVVGAVALIAVAVFALAQAPGKAAERAKAEERDRLAAEMARTNQLLSPPTSETPAPPLVAADYLTCGEPSPPSCEPLLAWKLTAEARQIIGGQEGLPGALNSENVWALIPQLLNLGAVDACGLSIGLEDAVDQETGVSYRRRVIYPDLSRVRLVDCTTPNPAARPATPITVPTAGDR